MADTPGPQPKGGRSPSPIALPTQIDNKPTFSLSSASIMSLALLRCGEPLMPSGSFDVHSRSPAGDLLTSLEAAIFSSRYHAAAKCSNGSITAAKQGWKLGCLNMKRSRGLSRVLAWLRTSVPRRVVDERDQSITPFDFPATVGDRYYIVQKRIALEISSCAVQSLVGEAE